jgi:hypothetical protein
MEIEERAADPLAGGIMPRGHQCGMLWGSALAVGAEAFRRYADRDRAVEAAVEATARIVHSFTELTNTVDCREIADADFSKPLQLLKYLLLRARYCFNLAEKWAPEAIRSACEGLAGGGEERTAGGSTGRDGARDAARCTGAADAAKDAAADAAAAAPRARGHQGPLSCATELARRMGAGEQEAVTVAGLAGGMGLSGHACGALGAAVWLQTLEWCREGSGSLKSAFRNPRAKAVLNAFDAAAGPRMHCHEITGRRFESIDDHAEFIRSGGCRELLDALARESEALERYAG